MATIHTSEIPLSQRIFSQRKTSVGLCYHPVIRHSNQLIALHTTLYLFSSRKQKWHSYGAQYLLGLMTKLWNMMWPLGRFLVGSPWTTQMQESVSFSKLHILLHFFSWTCRHALHGLSTLCQFVSATSLFYPTIYSVRTTLCWSSCQFNKWRPSVPSCCHRHQVWTSKLRNHEKKQCHSHIFPNILTPCLNDLHLVVWSCSSQFSQLICEHTVRFWYGILKPGDTTALSSRQRQGG